MARQSTNPLNDKHLKILNDVLQMCKETAEYCDKCAACGLNVDPEKRKNDEQMRLAERLKATFFPKAR